VRRLAIPRGVKLVAAMCAQYADLDGRHVRPGRERLAEETGYSLKQVDRHLATLRGFGLIVRTRSGSANGRRGLADEYRLQLPDDILDRVDFVKPIDVGPVDNHRNSGHQMSDDRSMDEKPDEGDHWTSDGDCFSGSLDTGVPITGHPDVHPPSHDHATTTPTPNHHSLFDEHSRRETRPVDNRENVIPFRSRGAA
jgi:hypothetical protein